MQEDIMTKEEFLYALRRALGGEVTPGDLEDNMRYYEDYIETEKRKGRSEEEVMESLGDPRLIAKTIIETSSRVNSGTYSSYAEESSGERQTERTERKEERAGNRNIRIYGGWKVILALVLILLVIVLILVLVIKAIGAMLYFLGPLLMVAIIIWLIRIRE